MDTPLLAFRVLAIGQFGFGRGKSSGREVTWFAGESVDEMMTEVEAWASVSVPRDLYEDGTLNLSFRSSKDFKPERILLTNQFTKRIHEAREEAARALKHGKSISHIKATLKEIPGLEKVRFPTTGKKTEPSGKASSAVDEILKMVAVPDEQNKEGPTRGDNLLDGVDRVIEAYLRALYNSPELRALESAWTGVKILTQAAKESENIQIGLYDMADSSLEEILDHLLVLLPLDLPTLILLDSGFDRSPRSLSLLEKVAELCDSLLVPIVVELTPGFLGLDNWDELDKRPYIPHYLQDQAYAKWQSLKKKPGGRWICCVCNRFLGRLRYGVVLSSKYVPFSERDFLWVSPVWGIAALMAISAGNWGWPSRFSDWRNCRLEDLPVRQIDARRAYPTQAGFSEDRIAQFAKAGIIALSSIANRDFVFAPFDATLGQSALGYQVMLTMTVQYLMWCKEHFAVDLPAEEIESGVKDILVLLWAKRGYDISDRVQVSISQGEDQDRKIVALTLRLPKELAPTGDLISLDMPW